MTKRPPWHRRPEGTPGHRRTACPTRRAKVPALGMSAAVRVSTGVLYRAMAVAGLDYSIEESYVLLERLLEEATAQRGAAALDG